CRIATYSRGVDGRLISRPTIPIARTAARTVAAIADVRQSATLRRSAARASLGSRGAAPRMRASIAGRRSRGGSISGAASASGAKRASQARIASSSSGSRRRRAALAARRRREPELDEAIRAWEARLAPLAEAAPEIEPPRDLLPAIEARIRGAAPREPSEALAALRRSVALWRTSAIAATVLAAVLAIGIVGREMSRPSTPREYVAILQKDAGSPAIEVTVNLDRRELTVRPVAARAPPGKAYELWIIDAKLGAPRSLGVIGESKRAANL